MLIDFWHFPTVLIHLWPFPVHTGSWGPIGTIGIIPNIFAPLYYLFSILLFLHISCIPYPGRIGLARCLLACLLACSLAAWFHAACLPLCCLTFADWFVNWFATLARVQDSWYADVMLFVWCTMDYNVFCTQRMMFWVVPESLPFTILNQRMNFAVVSNTSSIHA